MGNLIVEH